MNCYNRINEILDDMVDDIKYIKTEGQQGNIASNVLEKFYNNIYED